MLSINTMHGPIQSHKTVPLKEFSNTKMLCLQINFSGQYRHDTENQRAQQYVINCTEYVSFFYSFKHRLNMELDLQSIFGLHVHSCTHLLRLPNPPNPIWAQCAQLHSLAEPPQSPPPHLGSYTRALLVSQERRHLFF